MDDNWLVRFDKETKQDKLTRLGKIVAVLVFIVLAMVLLFIGAVILSLNEEQIDRQTPTDPFEPPDCGAFEGC